MGAKLLADLEAALAEAPPHVVAGYLFGSRARGDGTDASDVDVAVLVAADPPSTLAGFEFDLAGRLEQVLGLPVDLVVLNTAPVDLVNRVLRDGKLVLDRDRAFRVRFEVKTRFAYFDLLPYLRLYRRQRAGLP